MKPPPRIKQTFRLSAELSRDLADYARRRRVAQGDVVQAALSSHLSPDGADRLEAALARRLDRMTRQIDRLERHIMISNETLALFVRFWLTAVPPLPDYSPRPQLRQRAANASRAFVETLGRRLAKGRSFADEIVKDVPATTSADPDEE